MSRHKLANNTPLDELLVSLEESLARNESGPTRVIGLAPPAPSPTSDDEAAAAREAAEPTTPAADSIESVTSDLLRGVRAPGPAIVRVAEQAARSMAWIARWDELMEDLLDPAQCQDRGEGLFSMIERLARLRAAEVKALGRLLLTLDLLRDHEVQVRARVVERAQGIRSRRR